MAYIQSEKEKDGCVFCKAVAADDDESNLIVARAEHAFVILNRYPYTSGHVMVLPYDHVQTINELDAATRAEMMELVNHTTQVLGKVYHPEGFNLGANLGAAAGAGIEEHVHLHIVPRWFGDTNFMSAVGDTRVIPEDLAVTYQRIKAAW
jgi:ATP adenylyltransferase